MLELFKVAKFGGSLHKTPITQDCQILSKGPLACSLTSEILLEYQKCLQGPLVLLTDRYLRQRDPGDSGHSTN